MLYVQHKTDEWSLFNDSSKRIVKVVFLHNGNRVTSISVHVKETYGNLEQLLVKINYKRHHWMVCADLKVLCTVVGHNRGAQNSHITSLSGTVELR